MATVIHDVRGGCNTSAFSAREVTSDCLRMGGETASDLRNMFINGKFGASRLKRDLLLKVGMVLVAAKPLLAPAFCIR